MHDDAVRNLRYTKSLIAKYGQQQAAQLITLAKRLVDRGEFLNRRAAIEAIEEQMGLPITRD